MNILYDDVANAVDWISSFGGLKQGGTTRLLYSVEWLAAQNALKQRMTEIGMHSYFDDVGNLYGRFEGSKYKDEVIMSGSHVDTVVNGGKLDGQLGIIAALLAMQYLKENYGQPLRTLELISMAEEEGSRFPYVFWGSKNVFAIANHHDVETIQDSEGIKFVDAMQTCGFKFNTQPARNNIKAFLEIHIEQGGVLEKEQKSIGVVTSIVGQRRYNIRLIGEANHAGTTPMGYRKDAVYAFSRICNESINKAIKVGDPLVLTFGHVEPKPNVVNVVPGEVLFTMDCRHTNKAQLVQFTEEIEADMLRIANELGLEIEINRWMDEDPIPMDNKLIKMLEQICKEEKLSYRVMHSGAGHDSQIFAPRVPTAMLFVPSIKGISHNPAEDTDTKDLVEGIKALTHALYKLAYQE
ncbi:allantoate amidohydrolase [Gilliamella sp. wkB292]|uniref:allantoate deiminase n=1 Tax=Gilliamella sp. wkB292 TaxID=3120262 RepID=UPI00080E5C92|nr:allantoate deiminase [Gilliamella apicola]OCG13639.1 allantoate amidohydrolase [Gilliamella apicola]